MWASLLTTLLPVLLKVVEFFLDRKSNNDAAKKRFLEMVEKMSRERPDVARKLNQASRDQLEEIRKELEKKN